MSAADFIEETTTSIAGTNGNGAVTLSQQTGLPRFSSVFGTNPRHVDYVIEDTVGLKFEKGFGIVSGNVLTRTLVHATWDGTTYLNSGAVALAFGSAPTTGNIRIRLAPTVDASFRAPPALQLANTSFGGYNPSAHVNCPNGGTSTSFSTGIEYYFPYLNAIRGAVAGIGFKLNTVGAAGAQVKMGIYEVGPDGLPGACITQTNAIDAASGAGSVHADATPASWLVNPGPIRLATEWYYIGFLVNDATAAMWGQPLHAAGYQIAMPPIGSYGAYGWGSHVRKTAQNTFAVGLPTGVPTGAYTVGGAQEKQAGALLKIANS